MNFLLKKINLSKLSSTILLVVTVFLPVLVNAQKTSAYPTLIGLIREFMLILNALVPIIIGFAILAFLWGVFKYVFAKGQVDESAAKGVMVYGIIALFVMVSVWGLVRMIASVFDFELGGVLKQESRDTSDLYQKFIK